MAIPIPSRQLFIDGEWREPALRKRFPIVNPSTEEIIGDIPAATSEDVEIAVDAARRALARNKGRDWASAPGAVRAKYLRAIAAKITEKKSKLAELEAIDCGKPLDEAAWDIDDVAGCFEYYADLADGLDAKQKAPVALPMETFKSYVLKEPMGVVGLITPWNYPMLMATWKVAPALAAGCAAILKPSELASVSLPTDFVRLDQDILSPLAGKKQLYTYETLDFWEQIKTPGMSLKCSALYLAQFRFTSSHLLASGDGTKSAAITGDVFVHPSAKLHPTAKIGPNVSISANARIGAGVRLISCIILDDVEIKENAVVIHAIVGWKSSIGRWSRVQATGDCNAKLGVTILGEAVTVEDEVVVINSIVLPNKTLNVSVQEEIIL